MAETKEDVENVVMTETKIDIEAGLGKEGDEDQIRKGFPIQVLNKRKNNCKTLRSRSVWDEYSDIQIYSNIFGQILIANIFEFLLFLKTLYKWLIMVQNDSICVLKKHTK